MDFLWALLFFLWYEALTLPLRAALAGAPGSSDVRRLLSRVAGPALLVMPIWVLGHLYGWALGRSAGWIWAVMMLVLALWTCRGRVRLGRLLAYREGRGSEGPFRRQLLLDGVTLGLFFAFVGLRRWIPEMTTYAIDSSAAEKFMNMMIFWSNWHAPALPPEDYWLAGHRLSYYYWGHFHWAWVGRVGGFPGEAALNLGFARMVTLVFEASYLLARAFGLRLGWSALAAVAVAWAGNPRAVEGMWRVWQSSAHGYNWGAYDFWKPSRAIATSVIDEFPAFSAILGDFHAHHLALPWLVAWLALTVAGSPWLGASMTEVRAAGTRGVGGRGRVSWVVLWSGLGLASALTNLWNLPVMAVAMGLLLLVAARRNRRVAGMVLGLEVGLGLAVWVAVGMILGSDAQPLPVDAGAGWWERLPLKWLPSPLRSTPLQLFAMWGLPALAVGGAALVRGLSRRRHLLALSLAGWLAALVSSAPFGPELPFAAIWIWIAMVCWVLSLALGREAWLPNGAAWMVVASCAILAGLELVFVDDAYAGEYERYNSYFKLSYPLWPPLVVGAFAGAERVWTLREHPGISHRLAWAVRFGLIAVLAAAMVYPVCALPARLIAARRGDDPPRRPTLNAVDFLAHRPPYDEEAPMLAWIRDRVPPGEVVAEGRGRHAYGYVGRVASLAGRPVPLGWAHHERQWRGRIGHALTAERERAIDRLYRATSPEAMRREAADLGVEWVLYGLVERERYGDPEERVLRRLEKAGALSAAFPGERPTVFLFDFRGGEG
jgi:YYY domain-containing protein